MDQYSSNRTFMKEKQDLILNQRVLLFGESLTTEFSLFNLAGLGFEHIQHFSPILRPKIQSVLYSFRPKKRWIKGIKESMNSFLPHIKYQGINTNPLHYLIDEFQPTLCIDTSKDYKIQKIHATIAQKLSIPYFVGITQKNTIQIDIKPIRKIPHPSSHWLESLCASFVVDEARKHVATYTENEQKITNKKLIFDFSKDFTDNKKILWKQKNYQNALIVGAGGTGTYTAICEALKGTKSITIIDPDVVDIQNLNRQLLYANTIGKSKAKILSSRLKTINPTIQTFYEQTTFDTSTKQPWDIIFCCTDNFKSRLEVNNYAIQKQIPVMEGGCTPTHGVISSYVPRQTACIAQKRNLEFEAEREKKQPQNENQSCVRQANPSVITPNIIVGTLMSLYANYRMNEKHFVKPLHKNLNYSSVLQKKLYS